MTHDVTVRGGCSKKRPDFFFKDFSEIFHLIVEVDEFQHSKYSCSYEGEMKRLINIYEQDSGGFPLVVVRYNPDSYYKNNNVMITDLSYREKVLVDTINGLKNRKVVDKRIYVIYLFYDNFDNVELRPFEYKTENGKLIIDHKHPHTTKQINIYPL
jgi:hypothetical protein